MEVRHPSFVIASAIPFALINILRKRRFRSSWKMTRYSPEPSPASHAHYTGGACGRRCRVHQPPIPPNGGPQLPSTGHALQHPSACDAYLVTPKAAEAMARARLPVHLPTPMHLHYVVNTLGLRMYVLAQRIRGGSKIGAAVSTIQSNNLLIWNQPF
eukprot:gene790-2193_t